MKICIFGATGLTGGLLLEACLRHGHVQQVTIFVRKPLPLQHAKLRQVTTTMETLADVATDIDGDVVFNCLGTTLKKAGSQAAQYAIDCAYPVRVAQLAAANGVTCMVNVSSVGASERGNFYLKTKADMERGVREAIGEGAYFVRPSLIMGDRQEFRFGEKVGMWLTPIFDALMLGGLRKYHSVAAHNIAKAMLQVAIERPDSPKVLHYDDIMKMAGRH